MFLGYQNNKIKFYTEEELDAVLYNLDKSEETDEEYVLYGDEYILKSSVVDKLLNEAKEKKQKEASNKAKSAIENGFIEYKNAKFETNTQTVADLNTARQMCIILNESSYNWLSKDDILINLVVDVENPVENDDFVKIGVLISEFKNTVWTKKYANYLQAINAAASLEELDDIDIDYSISG